MLQALLALFLTAPALAQDVAQIALHEGGTIAGVQGEIDVIRAISAGVDHGWVAEVDLVGTAGGPPRVLVGVRTHGALDAPTLLRAPVTIGSFAQDSILWNPTMVGGEVHYIATNTNQPGEWGVWREDQLLLRSGDLIGNTQDVWRHFSSAQPLLNGDVLIKGYSDDGNGNPDVAVVLHYPSQTIVRTSNDVLPGSSLPIGPFGYEASPNGQHSLTGVGYGSFTTSAILLDGQPLDLGGGALMRTGQPIPASIAGVSGLTWGPLGIRDVNDNGDYCVIGLYYIGADTYMLSVRNGRPIGPAMEYWLQPDVGDMNERGFLTTRTNWGQAPAMLEETPLLGANPRFDVDFDGLADPEWQYDPADKLRLQTSGPRSETFLRGPLEDTTNGTTHDALIRLAPYDLGAVTCAGVVNSSGTSGKLLAHRSDVAATNDFILQSIGLPQDVTGLFLATQTGGFTATPGGSQGNLCLGGAIGRLTSQVFDSGLAGRGKATVDLTAVPQPGAPVVALPGETWHFQAWHRDTVGGLSTSNFTEALSVLLR